MFKPIRRTEPFLEKEMVELNLEPALKPIKANCSLSEYILTVEVNNVKNDS